MIITRCASQLSTRLFPLAREKKVSAQLRIAATYYFLVNNLQTANMAEAA